MSGIELDATAGPLEVVAGLSVELNRMNDLAEGRAAQERRIRESERARMPSDVRFFSSGICPTPTAPFGISLSGPDNGFYWILRRLFVGGLTWATTAAGSSEIYVTGLTSALAVADPRGIAAVSSLSDMVDQSATMPNKAFYSSRQVIIQPNENLVAVIRTGTAGQQYVVAAQVEVHRILSGPSEQTI